VGERDEVYGDPRHPYTQTLLAAVPTPDPRRRSRHVPVAGDVPSPMSPPSGCSFHPRCPHAVDACRRLAPTLDVGRTGRAVACHVFPADAGG
jgi:oligopeptide/dipeptide ABC transporter ATP-binding protein